MTAVLLAKNYDMVHQLVGDVDHLLREDRSRILWHACDIGDLSMVQSVIGADCDVDHIHRGQTPVMMATLRGHDIIVKELILSNCDVNFKSSACFSDLTLTLLLSRLIRVKASYWLAALFCVLLPWMEFQVHAVAMLGVNPVWGTLVLIAMSVLASVEDLPMPESWIDLSVYGLVTIALVLSMNVAMVAGPAIWTMFVMMIVAITLVIQGRKATVAAAAKEVIMTAVFVALGLCVLLGMILVMPLILVWSPQNVCISNAEAVIGSLIFMPLFVLASVSLKQIIPVWQGLVVVLLEGVILTAELFVIASSCILSGRKAFGLNESHTAHGMVEVLMTVLLFTWFLLLVLRTVKTELALYRGALGFIVFVAIKLLNMESALVSLDKLHLVLTVVVVTRYLAGILSITTKKTVLLKAVVVALHLVVAVAEVNLAIVISKEEPKLQVGVVNRGEFVNALVVMVMVLAVQAPCDTALHYAAVYNHIMCGVLLVEAGADVFATNKHRLNPMEDGSKTFVDEVQKVLSFTTKRVIAVIGNSEYGKSTLVAALECTSNVLWKKIENHFK